MPFVFDYTVHQQINLCSTFFISEFCANLRITFAVIFALTHIVSSQQLQICISASNGHYSPRNDVAELAYFAAFEFCLW